MPEERRQQLRTEMIARLHRVRGQMTDDEFAELVSSVERAAARFAEIDAAPHKLRPAPPPELPPHDG
jgi:hypothetical protein